MHVSSLSYNETQRLSDGSAFGLEPSSEYPFNTTYVKAKEALVTVNGDCEITIWNFTGDSDADLNQAYEDLYVQPAVFCTFDPENAACTISSIGDDNGDSSVAGGSASSNYLWLVTLFAGLFMK